MLLDEIQHAYDAQEITAIVERAKQSGSFVDSIPAILTRYSQTLSAKEIQDLNILLLWAMYAESGPQISQVKGSIFLKRGESPLKPFYDQITERFSAFFTIREDMGYDEDSIALKSNTIAEYFRGLNTNQRTSKATDREIRMLRNIIRTFCDEDLYMDLELPEFFERKLSNDSTSIGVDCDNAHALIVVDCLRAMSQPCQATQGLVIYGSYHVLSHLRKLGAGGVYSKTEADVGLILVKMLRDPATICRAMGYYSYAYADWPFDDDLSKELARLLHSSAVMKNVVTGPQDDKGWLESIRESPTPEVDIFHAAAAVASEHLLTSLSSVDEIGKVAAFKWLFGLHNKCQNIRDSRNYPRVKGLYDFASSPSNKGSACMTEIPIPAIHATFEFARSFLDDPPGQLETLRGLAEVYSACYHLDAAISAFQEVLAASKNDIWEMTRLCDAYASRAKVDVLQLGRQRGAEGQSRKDIEDAIRCAEFIVATEDSKSNDNNPWAGLWDIYIRKLASWKLVLQQYADVEKIYLKLIANKPDDIQTRRHLVLLMCEEKRYDEAVALIKNLDEQHSLTPNVNVSKFLIELGWSSKLDAEYGGCSWSTIVYAFKQENELACFKKWCITVLDNTVNSDSENKTIFFLSYLLLKFYVASFLYRHAETSAESARAMQLWEEVLVRKEAKDFVDNPQYQSGKRLATVYTERAVVAGRNSAEADEMIMKIKALEPIEMEGDEETTLSKAMVRSVLGRCYIGLHDIENARETLKPNVEVGIKLLSDGDDDNDDEGLRKLGRALMDFGDDTNALAAWGMLAPEDDAQIEDRTYLRCHGAYGRQFSSLDSIWICQQCVEVCFDQECYEKLRAGTLIEDVCDPKHTFFHIPPWDADGIERARAKHVLVGDTVMPLQEWLTRISID